MQMKDKTMKLSKQQIWKIVGVVALVLLMISGIVLGIVFGIKSNTQTLQDDDPIQSSPLVITCESENGIMLASSEATTASDGTISKDLTAIITPDNASNKNVSWSCAWENSSDSWASGKSVSSYISISPYEDNSLKATVVCKEAFGAPIVVTAHTTDGSNLSASCKCDYVKRVEKVDLIVPKSSMADDTTGFDTSTTSQPWKVKMYADIPDTGQGSFKTSIVWGVGTIEEDVAVSVSYYLTDDYYQQLAQKGYATFVDGVFSGTRYDSGVVTLFNTNSSGVRAMFGSNFYDDVSYREAVIYALQHCPWRAISFKVTAIGEHNDYCIEYPCTIVTSRMEVLAKTIQVSPLVLTF